MMPAHAPPARHDLAALKPRLPVAAAWVALGLPGRPAARCGSPFRPDRRPSFSIYKDGLRWKDFGTGRGGDVIDFIGEACALDRAEATRRFLALVGAAPAHGLTESVSKSAGPPRSLALPPLHAPAPAEIAAVAEARGLSLDAVSLAVTLRTVVFGQVHGWDCWILTDATRRVAEARRIDGLPFPAAGALGERKAHTLAGSRKAWPAGVAALAARPGWGVMLVEGGPDYLAALHFAAQSPRAALPVAMLGRGTGSRIDPQALALLRGRRVRLYPHADADGGGLTAGMNWAAQLHAAGCEVDWFDFTPLRTAAGQPVKDLNDAVFTRPAQAAALAP